MIVVRANGAKSIPLPTECRERLLRVPDTGRQTSKVNIYITYMLIHSFIHYKDLYSAPSRLLLRSTPDPSTAENIYICVHMYIYINTHIYAYIYKYIHTYTHTHIYIANKHNNHSNNNIDTAQSYISFTNLFFTYH